MSDQQMGPVDNIDEDIKDRRQEERRIAQRRKGDDVEYLKHAENRRRADRRKADRRVSTLDHTLTDMLDKGPDVDKIIKIVFTRVLFVIAMAIAFYFIVTHMIVPKKFFGDNFDNLQKIEDVKK